MLATGVTPVLADKLAVWQDHQGWAAHQGCGRFLHGCAARGRLVYGTIPNPECQLCPMMHGCASRCQEVASAAQNTFELRMPQARPRLSEPW